MNIRTVSAFIGLPALVLGLVTTSAASAAAPTQAPTQAPTVVKHSVDDGECDRIRFGPASAKQSKAFPTRIKLPNGFQPEGIAIRGATAYFGSLVDGDIYAATLRNGRGKIISQGPGTPSVGLKADHRGRLWVAGGPNGTARVVDIRSGKILKSYPLTKSTPTFVNDVVLSRNSAWFTDSSRPVVYQVPIGRHGQLLNKVRTIPLKGAYVHDPTGFNGNGISLTPDGRALLIVQSSTGFLFRVDPRTGFTKRVNLGGTLMTNGDGLLLQGRTLYVVQNLLNRVAVLKLNRAGTVGRQVRTITDKSFDVPTTAAAFGNRLYLPNARFTTTPTPTTPYWATAVRR
ncbi:superoxide dismutase [Kribbella sp. NPDC048915]|uniref:SMP-30/gluconolactonase/LRE family protein n=1 Tax=Kribbella sp. NPDC048915 TaxID=3155148 RepID=UPI0033CDC6EE